MKKSLCVYSAESSACGNETTALRIQRVFSVGLGIDCVLLNVALNDSERPSVSPAARIASILESSSEKMTCIIGIHAFRAGGPICQALELVSLEKVCPFILVLGGTDVNEDCSDEERELSSPSSSRQAIIWNSFCTASAIVAFTHAMEERYKSFCARKETRLSSAPWTPLPQLAGAVVQHNTSVGIEDNKIGGRGGACTLVTASEEEKGDEASCSNSATSTAADSVSMSSEASGSRAYCKRVYVTPQAVDIPASVFSQETAAVAKCRKEGFPTSAASTHTSSPQQSMSETSTSSSSSAGTVRTSTEGTHSSCHSTSATAHHLDVDLRRYLRLPDDAIVLLLPAGLRAVKDPLFLAEALIEWSKKAPEKQSLLYLVILGPALDVTITAAVIAASAASVMQMLEVESSNNIANAGGGEPPREGNMSSQEPANSISSSSSSSSSLSSSPSSKAVAAVGPLLPEHATTAAVSLSVKSSASDAPSSVSSLSETFPSKHPLSTSHRVIIYHGSVKQSDLWSWMLQADFVVNTSISEGQSSAVLEAMALGCTVLARRNEGNVSLIHHGGNGLLFETPEEAIRLCLAHRTTRKEGWGVSMHAQSALGTSAAHFVAEHHSLESEKSAWRKILHDL